MIVTHELRHHRSRGGAVDQPPGRVAVAAAAYPAAARPSPPRPGNLHALQALRACAALGVVLLHTSVSFFGTARYWPDQPFGPVFNFGHAGVEFFFVLSGFIIFAAHRRDIGVESRLLPFLWKRFRRIYPVYWAMLAAIVPLYILVPGFGNATHRDPGVLVDSVLLLHVFGHHAVVLTVSWTLFHELLFYGAFALLVLNRSLGTAVMAAWLAGSVVAVAVPDLPKALAFYFSPMHLLFGMGIGAAALANARPIPAPGWVALAGAVLFFGAGADEVAATLMRPELRMLVYGLGSTMILLGAIELERTGRLRVPRALVFLGNASAYSIYLVHFVALSVAAKVAVALLERVPVPHGVVFVALAAASVAAGVAFHLAVEIPLLASLGKRELSSASKHRVGSAWRTT